MGRRPLTTNAVQYWPALTGGNWSNLLEVVNATPSEVTTNQDGLSGPGHQGFYQIKSWRYQSRL